MIIRIERTGIDCVLVTGPELSCDHADHAPAIEQKAGVPMVPFAKDS
jgi:hypothetical protein